MITFLSRRIALFLKDNEIVDEETSQVCQYGFEIIISTLVGFLLVVSIGIICGELISAMLFYALFVGVRLSTGGYHASTHLKCKLLLCLCCTFTILTTKFFIGNYDFGIQSLILLFYILTVLKLSPVEHKNAPLDELAMKHNRLISIIVSVILTVVNSLGFSEFKKIAMISSLTLFVVAFLMLLSIISEGRKNNEK